MMNPRSLLLSIALASFGLIGVALYLQHVVDLLPCPLCVIQRYLFLLVGFACLAAYFMKNTAIGKSVALMSALGGLGVAGKHLYVLAHPGLSCGIDPMETLLNKIPTATYLPFLFQADGLCENATDGLLGMSIPQWSFVWFGLFAVALGWSLLRRRAP